MNKKRTELPNFVKIDHIKVDAPKLLKCFDYWQHEQDHLSARFGDKYLNDKYFQEPITTAIPDENGEVRLFRGKEDERYYGKLVDKFVGTYVEEVLGMFKAQVTRVRLIVKKPGAYILPHVDYDTTYSVRYYIPLQTNPWSYTAIKGKDDIKPEILQMDPDGSCWFFNNGNYHSAWNMGSENWMGMIVACNGQEDLEGYV